jgi:RNA polymerase sigma-70 factor (ECF subfamily)
MSHAHAAPRLDELVAEIGWVRRLARALVGDAAGGDDVAHEAWLRALEHPPSEPGPLRPWLRRVVINAARMRFRASRRREAREARDAAAAPDEVATPAELVERVELARAVAGEVLALDEPYRSTVLLRFVEGLSSAEIARRLGVPDGTVRRRLKVALDQLRERLQAVRDRPHPGWLAALVPLAQRSEPPPVAANTLGVVAMKKLIALVVVLVVLVLIGAAVWWPRGEPAGGPGDPGGVITATAGAARRPAAGHPAQAAAAMPAWLAQVGVAGRRIAGHVRAADAAVAGATVRLAMISAPGAIEPLAERRAERDGGFDFGVQPAASFAVSAEAPGLTASVAVVNVADPTARPDEVVLRLGACRSRLYGSVRDASGGAIARARLSSTEIGGVESDAAGQYSICLPDHNSRVRVEADGYSTIALPLHLFGALHHDIVLVPEAILIGQVVTRGDAPVVGARVVARPDDDLGRTAAPRFATSDRDGRFQITGLAPGKFQLRAYAGPLGSAAPQLAIARPAAASRELQLRVDPLAEVRGRVVMAGRPVGGARIIALGDSVLVSARSVSQPDGSFVLSGAAPGTVKLIAPPYEVVSPTSLEIASDRIDGVVLEVAALATLHGRVTRGGVPVADAEVVSMRAQIRTRSDATGAYVLEGLAPGTHWIHAVGLEVRAAAEDTRVALVAGDNPALDIELAHVGEVTGRVVDQRGAPVAGVYVHLDPVGRPLGARGGESMTDARGGFDCWSVPAGDYIASVWPSPSPVHAFELASDPGPIHLAKGGKATGLSLAIKHEPVAIRGVVVDDRGDELADVYVEAIAGHDYGTMLRASAMSDGQGRFEIADLARGSYQLRARAADGSAAELASVSAGAEPVTIALARAGAIEGALVGFSAAPVVVLRGDAGKAPSIRATVSGHAFSLPGLAPGRYLIEARVGEEVDGQTAELKPGETLHLTLHGRGMSRIEGRIIEYASKAAVAGMRCTASLSLAGTMGELPADAPTASSDAAGRFSIAAPIGGVRVFCIPPDGSGLSAAGGDVEVDGSGSARVELAAVRLAPGAHGNPGFTLVHGVLPLTVAAIDPHGAAASSGLAPGDHLVAVDGADLHGLLPIGAATLLANHAPSSSVQLAIERGGAAQTIALIMGTGNH